ncbi:hypothetical protein NBRC116594_31130 [Shimia sp. NS0008-38b]
MTTKELRQTKAHTIFKSQPQTARTNLTIGFGLDFFFEFFERVRDFGFFFNAREFLTSDLLVGLEGFRP